MEKLTTNDELVGNELIGMKLLESYKYWTKMRVVFNMLVSFTSILLVLLYISYLGPFEYFWILVWGLVANGLYSTGYALESYLIVRSRGTNNTTWSKDTLFWIGIIAYICLSVLFSFVYSSMIKPY